MDIIPVIPGKRLSRWLLISAPLLSGCDPLVSLQGSFWPPWIIVMVAAFPLTVLAHHILKWLGLSETLTPPVIIYPALWALMTFLCWLIAFQW